MKLLRIMSLILKSRLHIGWKLGCVVHEEIRGSTRLEWFRCSPKEIVSADSVSTSSHLYAFKPSIFFICIRFFSHQTSVLFAVVMSITLVSGQFFGTFDNSYRFGYDSSASVDDVSGGSSFGSFGGSRLRDPRQNRGKHIIRLHIFIQPQKRFVIYFYRPLEESVYQRVSVFRISHIAYPSLCIYYFVVIW